LEFCFFIVKIIFHQQTELNVIKQKILHFKCPSKYLQAPNYKRTDCPTARTPLATEWMVSSERTCTYREKARALRVREDSAHQWEWRRPFARSLTTGSHRRWTATERAASRRRREGEGVNKLEKNITFTLLTLTLKLWNVFHIMWLLCYDQIFVMTKVFF